MKTRKRSSSEDRKQCRSEISKHKRVWPYFCGAGLLLLLCGVVIFVLLYRDREAKKEKESSGTVTNAPTPIGDNLPSPTEVPTLTPTEVPSPSPIEVPSPTPTGVPSPGLPGKTSTLLRMEKTDYITSSVTGMEGEQFSLERLKEWVTPYGSWLGNAGMPMEEYRAAMERTFVDCTEPSLDYEKQELVLAQSYTYEELVSMMKMLSRLPGVSLYDIGTSTAGRTMYALEVDRTEGDAERCILLTGNTHARETAGTMYILKELIDLLQNEESEEITEYLSRVKIVAVPCVNPDGREGVSFDTENYTYANGQLWKATSNGSDLNRNFPGLSFGQILSGNKRASSWSNDSRTLFYPGDYGGSCNETKAMMKFLYHYIVVEKADILVDYHQQGRVGYAGKPWQTKVAEARCVDLAKTMFFYINEGNSAKYQFIPEEPSYGLRGEGSTVTDYACSLAAGAKFSPQFGFLVMTDGVEERPLITIEDLDRVSYPEANDTFCTMTFEIGANATTLGYSETARKKQENEYFSYHFDTVLVRLLEYALRNIAD